MRVLQPNLCFGLNPWPRNATAPAGPVRPARGACTQRQSRDGQVGAQRTSRQIVPLSSCRADDASNASRPAGRLLRAAYGTRPRARHGYRSGSRSTSPRASSRVHVVPGCRRRSARGGRVRTAFSILNGAVPADLSSAAAPPIDRDFYFV